MFGRWQSAVVALFVALSGTALADTWPSKPIRVVIPFSAGSATDIIPRAVFEQLSIELGQPIIVENRPGGGGIVGVGSVVRAEPDGYTLLANSSAHTIAPWIVPNIPYDTANDLAAVIPLGKNPNVLVVSPEKGWKTIHDMVAAAKSRPGTFNYGSAGVGTATHISAERLRQSAGMQAQHVPYRGGPEAITDVLGGRVDFYYCPISTAIPLIRDRRLLGLAVSTPTRASALPEIPTSLEAGFANSDSTIWYGVFAPAKMSREIIDRLHAATVKVLQSRAMQQRLAQLAVDPMPMSPAEFDRLVRDEIAANEAVIKAAVIK
jgi:tripartite-type tricarboxylate transporter receptor subunit TctC